MRQHSPFEHKLLACGYGAAAVILAYTSTFQAMLNAFLSAYHIPGINHVACWLIGIAVGIGSYRGWIGKRTVLAGNVFIVVALGVNAALGVTYKLAPELLNVWLPVWARTSVAPLGVAAVVAIMVHRRNII